MAKEVLEMEVKSNIGEVTKDTKELTNEASNAAGEFQVMGVSLNGVKKGFASAAVTAKGMFGSIKSGLISTGIGAFVVLIGSLVSFFTKTKKGAELLEVALAGIGAIVNVLTDSFSSLGKTIINTFVEPIPAIVKFGKSLKTFLTDPTGATRDMFVRAAISAKDFTKELVEDTKAMMILKEAMLKLRDSQRELNVETAQSIAFIEKQKLIAEDITKTYAEREEAATKAFNEETRLETKRIKLAEQAVEQEKIRQSIIGVDAVMAEDLDALADLEINLANVRQESAGRQISLQNFLNGLRNEELSKLEEIKAAEIERFEGIEKLVTETINADGQIILSDNAVLSNYLTNNEKIKKSDEAVKVAKLGVTRAIGGAVGALSGLMAEGTAASKAAALAEIAISTGVGIVQGLDIAQKSAKATGPAAAFAFPLFYATQLAAVLGAAAQAKTILGAGGGAVGGGGGGGSVAAPSTPAPQMMSGAFDISGGVAPEATKAFVVTDEMTNSQNQLANIRRRATI